MITPPEAQNRSPNCTSTRSGRAACPAFSIISAVGFLDFATSTIASCAGRTPPARYRPPSPPGRTWPRSRSPGRSPPRSRYPRSHRDQPPGSHHAPPAPLPGTGQRRPASLRPAERLQHIPRRLRRAAGRRLGPGHRDRLDLNLDIPDPDRDQPPRSHHTHPPRPPRNGSTAWQAISSQGMTIALPIPPRHRMATMQFVRLGVGIRLGWILRRGGPAILTGSDSDAPPDAGLPVRYAQGTRARPS